MWRSAAPGSAARPPRWPSGWAAPPWGERHPDSVLTRMMRRPGFEIQRLIGTREPTEEQLEVGRAALAEILRVEGGSVEADRVAGG